jgi:pimeloyl-ACP methyl ester carboxylesterase
MREYVFAFGPNGDIVGILTEPDAAVARPDAPIVIASNVGLNHRVGPYRSYVDLARRLAALGYPMFRFDLSGLGDSAPRRDNRNEIERAVLDVKDAMEALAERRGARRFIQLGFCSGVDSAHLIAREDPRVVGAIFIEGYSFPTPTFYARRYLRRPMNLRFWKLYLSDKLRRLHLARGAGPSEAGERYEIYSRSYPSRAQLIEDFRALTARDVQMLFVYVGGTGADYAHNYAGQFYENFPLLRGDRHVELKYFEHADHIFTYLIDREQLFACVTVWITLSFPGAPRASAAAQRSAQPTNDDEPIVRGEP